MSNYTVYTGFWRDHSQPGLSGFTLTLSVSSASLLVSGLATFVTLVGGRFWSLVAYAIHQIRAKDRASDGVHHQHQVIYRNASSHLTATWHILQIGWAWKKRANRVFGRTMLFGLPPFLTFVLFSLASIFSAKTTAPAYASNQVLIIPQNCGLLSFNTTSATGSSQQTLEILFTVWSTQDLAISLAYARSCYEPTDFPSASCGVYAAQSLPYDVNRTADCPLMKGRCLNGQQGSLKMATPWLDSQLHFGINDYPENRVKFRRETTCSMIEMAEDLVGSSTAPNGETYDYAYLGSTFARNYTFYALSTIQTAGIKYDLK
jgi:hypothetical protein